jgi:hypothetical protein
MKGKIMKFNKKYVALSLLLASYSVFGMNNNPNNNPNQNNNNQNALYLAALMNPVVYGYSNKHQALLDFINNPLDELKDKNLTKQELLQALCLDAIEEIDFELMDFTGTDFTSMTAGLETFLHTITLGYIGTDRSKENEKKTALGVKKYDNLLPYQNLFTIYRAYCRTGNSDILHALTKDIDLDDHQKDICAFMLGVLRAQAEVDTPKLNKLNNVTFSFK